MTQRELEIRAFLHDIAESGTFIEDYVRGVSFENYVGDRKTRVAVEREFITIGEALQRLIRVEPALANVFLDAPRIVSFRNSLTHGYRNIDPQKVWDIINVSLPDLLAKVRTLLGDG
jgi:uncharacterized protein with HEPN domain